MRIVSRTMVRAVLVTAGFLSAVLLAQQQTQPPPPTDGLPGSQDIMAYLNQSIDWRHRITAQEQIVTDSADETFLNSGQQISMQVLRLSFDFARAAVQAGASNANPQGWRKGAAWLADRARRGGHACVREQSQQLSRDAVEQIVRKHVMTAAKTCPSLKGKCVTPHVLRHSAAMQLLQNGVDRTVIALWLGHESVETTQMYIHADMQIKEKAMARTRAVPTKSVRYQPDDKLLAFLEAL